MSIRTKRNSRRFIAAAAAVAVAVSTFATTFSPAGAAASVTVATRVAGADRFATANAIAESAFAGTLAGPTSAVLASGNSFADGLAASALAGALGAPLLLTDSQNLTPSTLTTLQKFINVTTVVIVGGTAAVSDNVSAILTGLSKNVVRFAGADRYATANAVAAAVRTNNSGNIGVFGGYRTAFLGTGKNFADAVAASGWAHFGKHPIFLTDGETLSADTKAALIAAGVQQVIILGGTAAVSSAVATEVTATSGILSVVRVDGATRYDTATKLADTLSVADPRYKSHVALVDGTNFPDALAASQLVGKAGANWAIIPVTSPLPTTVATWLTTNQATITNMIPIGGVAAVSADTVTAARAAATTAKPTATVEALDGGTTATVTFSAPMTGGAGAGGAEVLTSYSRTSAAGAVSNPISVAYTFSATTGVSRALLTFATKLAVGDVVAVVANVINHVSNGTTAAASSATVAADSSAPSINLTVFPTATSTNPRVWVTFSANVDETSFADTDLVHVPAAIGGTPATFTCSDIGTFAFTLTKACDVTGTIAAGETVRIAASAVTTKATTPVGSPLVNAVATSDTTPPVLQTARYAQSAVGGVQATLADIGTTSVGSLTVAARAATDAAGRAGNSWEVVTAVGAIGVALNAATKTVTVTATATDSATDVASALNVNAAFSALFIASTPTSGALTGWTANGATSMAGGRDLLSVTLTFDGALRAAAQSDFTLGAQITNPAGQALTTAAATNNGLLTGVLTLTVQTDGAPVAGVTTVAVANTVLDRAGNALVPASNIVAMTPAS